MQNSSGLSSRFLILVLVLLATASCGDGDGDGFAPPPTTPPPTNPPPTLAITTVRAFPALTFLQPVAMVQAPGNTRWYVAQRGGIIRTFSNDPNVAASTIFGNLSSIVNTGGSEAGLLGIAFHPNFAVNGEVYVSYTGTASGGGLISRISRFASQGGITLVTTSEEELLTMAQPDNNHNGGQIAFGPDGYLYAGFGDGGGSGDPRNYGQNTTNLFGTIIRIDVDLGNPYTIPSNNPFALSPRCTQGVGVANCPEIFAWGFRNPWRWSFDSLTGALWVGDVGQSSWEEINRVEISMNYGWRFREGAHCFNPSSGCPTSSVDPITEYGHGSGDISVTGGYVYRGTGIAGLAGTYLFGDFGSGRIWGVPASSAQGTVPTEMLDSTHSIASFAEDQDGELYVVDYSGGIFQIVRAP